MEGPHPAFTLVLALTAGVLAQSLARHLRLPGIVLLLLVGGALGPDGFDWVRPGELGEGLLVIVELSVAIILFEGGLNLQITRLRREQAAIRRLVLGGSLFTLIGGALAVRFLLGWDWMTALVFGSLVVVTGPTVVTPLVEELRLRPRVATVLEAEGILIDPVGAILAVLMLDVALGPGVDSLASGATVLVYRVGVGLLAGVVGGFVLAGLLRVQRLVPEGLENLVVLAGVLFLFQGCNEVFSQSGLLAVTIAGVVVGNLRSRVDRDLREFKDQLSVLLIGLLFVLLAASVRLDDVRALGWRGVAVVGVLVLLVRPLMVWLATARSDLELREKLLIGWLGPRGIVAAAVASATAVALERAGVEGGPELLALVFLVISCTVLLAGITALPVASLLAQRLPGREGVAILGAQGLGLLLGRELRRAGLPVVFLDSNPGNCRRAEELDFPVVYGNALQERSLQRARIETVGSVVGLTANQMLNGVFVSRVRERFRVPRGYVAVARPETGLAPELVREATALVLFDGPHDVERWEVLARHEGIELERWMRRAGPAEEVSDAGRAVRDSYVILTVRRGSRTQPMHTRFEFKSGDVVAVAVDAEVRDDAHSALRALGFEPSSAEEEAA